MILIAIIMVLQADHPLTPTTGRDLQQLIDPVTGRYMVITGRLTVLIRQAGGTHFYHAAIVIFTVCQVIISV